MKAELEYGEFSRRVHDRAAGKVIKAQMELTYGCNLKCLHCYTDCFNTIEHKRREMSTAEILNILVQMAEHGILWLYLLSTALFPLRL